MTLLGSRRKRDSPARDALFPPSLTLDLFTGGHELSLHVWASAGLIEKGRKMLGRVRATYAHPNSVWRQTLSGLRRGKRLDSDYHNAYMRTTFSWFTCYCW